MFNNEIVDDKLSMTSVILFILTNEAIIEHNSKKKYQINTMLKCRSEKKNTFEKNRHSSSVHASTENRTPPIESTIKIVLSHSFLNCNYFSASFITSSKLDSRRLKLFSTFSALLSFGEYQSHLEKISLRSADLNSYPYFA